MEKVQILVFTIPEHVFTKKRGQKQECPNMCFHVFTKTNSKFKHRFSRFPNSFFTKQKVRWDPMARHTIFTTPCLFCATNNNGHFSRILPGFGADTFPTVLVWLCDFFEGAGRRKTEFKKDRKLRKRCWKKGGSGWRNGTHSSPLYPGFAYRGMRRRLIRKSRGGLQIKSRSLGLCSLHLSCVRRLPLLPERSMRSSSRFVSRSWQCWGSSSSCPRCPSSSCRGTPDPVKSQPHPPVAGASILIESMWWERFHRHQHIYNYSRLTADGAGTGPALRPSKAVSPLSGADGSARPRSASRFFLFGVEKAEGNNIRCRDFYNPSVFRRISVHWLQGWWHRFGLCILHIWIRLVPNSNSKLKLKLNLKTPNSNSNSNVFQDAHSNSNSKNSNSISKTQTQTQNSNSNSKLKLTLILTHPNLMEIQGLPLGIEEHEKTKGFRNCSKLHQMIELCELSSKTTLVSPDDIYSDENRHIKSLVHIISAPPPPLLGPWFVMNQIWWKFKGVP